MKTILFSLFMFSLTFVIAQGKEAEPSFVKSSKLTFGWSYSPEFSYRILSKGSEAGGNTAQSIEYSNSNGRPKFGQSCVLFIGYKLSDKYTLEGGLGYTDFGAATKPKEIYYMATDNDPSSTVITSSVHHLPIISIPINIRAHFGQNRLRGFVSAGIAPGILVKYRYSIHREYSSGNITKHTYTNNQDKYSKFNLVAQISGGFDYQCTRRVDLRVAPIFRMTTNSMLTDKKIRGNYFNAGIEIGTIFRL